MTVSGRFLPLVPGWNMSAAGHPINASIPPRKRDISPIQSRAHLTCPRAGEYRSPTSTLDIADISLSSYGHCLEEGARSDTGRPPPPIGWPLHSHAGTEFTRQYMAGEAKCSPAPDSFSWVPCQRPQWSQKE